MSRRGGAVPPEDGTQGKVYSKSLRQEFDAQVGPPGRPGLHPEKFTVYFDYNGRRFRKTLRASSGKFKPMTTQGVSSMTPMDFRAFKMDDSTTELEEGSDSGLSMCESNEDPSLRFWRVKSRWQELVNTSKVEISADGAGCRGLANLGNTCFMNAALQVLSHIEPLVLYFLTDGYQQELRPDNPAGSGGSIAEAFAQLQRYQWKKSDDDRFAPEAFLTAFATWERSTQNWGTRLFADRPGWDQGQQDGQEFFSRLFQVLHEDVNQGELVEVDQQRATEATRPSWSVFDGKTRRTLKADPTCQDALDVVYSEEAAKAWMHHLGCSKSFFEDVFAFQVRGCRTCTKCKSEVHTYEPQKNLMVPINESPDVHSALFLFFSEEEELRAECEHCKQITKNKRSLKLQSSPDILIITLARFTPDDDNPTEFHKDTSRIDLQQDLDLKYCIENQGGSLKYELVGVIDHSGRMGFGHYTATCKNPFDGNWYEYNDNKVSQVDAPSQSDTCYVCVYQRTKGHAKRQTISKPDTWQVKASRHNSIMKQEAAKYKEVLASSKKEWSCPKCTLLNPAKASKCSACGADQ